MSIDLAARRMIRVRAGNRCEYCHSRQEELPYVTFHVEHVIAKQHEGGDDVANLCLSCHWCNYNKGPNIATHVDGLLVPLFNPRVQRWSEHFNEQGDEIVGLTAIGRGTVRLLAMNDDDRRELRRFVRG